MNAPTPRQKPPAADVGGATAYRRELEGGGRVYVDRPLPFLVLNRTDPDAPASLAHRVATITASNVVWPARAQADAAALAGIVEVLAALHPDFPAFLLVSVRDLQVDASLGGDSPRLEPFRFVLGASADEPAQCAARCLQAALSKICIDLREPAIEWIDDAWTEPGIEAIVDGIDGLSRLSLGLPQIHRVPGADVPGQGRIYPQIFHELETRVLDALLQAFAAFVDATTPRDDDAERARPHRSLGRSRYIEAAVEVDRELGRIARSFDFLLGVSPIDSMQAWERFEADKRDADPVFRYRPLSVDPDLAKRDLYAIDLRAVEDPVLETLFREKQQDLDQQLMMLQRRNTRAFRHVSLLQYGGVEAPLLGQARAILARVGHGEADRATGIAMADCHAIRDAAEEMIARYRHKVPAFKGATVCLREDIAPGLMVSGESLLVSTSTHMTRARLDPLLQHEVGVHLLTCVNGNQQGLGIFGAGLAGYEGVQEGLGVFAEFACGGLTTARLRLLAARVIVVDAMLAGAGFVDCHRMLHAEHGFTSLRAFNIVARVFRSGGLTKDAIYLRGFNQVFAFVASGRELDPFWFGKIAERHVPVVEELRARGILRLPAATPEFLGRPEARHMIERIRAGASFIDLFGSPRPC